MFQVKLVKNDGSKIYDITPILTQYDWDYKMSLASIINLSVIDSGNQYMPVNPVDIGDLVIIYKDGSEVTRGIIVDEKGTGGKTMSYVAYDYAWYLGESKSVYQFNGVRASEAIRKILDEFGMPIGTIVTMNTVIDQIYIQKSPADIIKDIIDQHEHMTGVRIFAEQKNGKIHILNVSDLVVIGKFKLAYNIGEANVLSNPLGAERTRTIKSMRNRVKIILSQNDNFQTVALAQNSEAAGKYGLLEETFKIDEADAAKARQVAKILLARLCRIHETNKISLMGDVAFRSGRLFDVVEEKTGMAGRFMITETKHYVESGGIHTMDLVLTLQEDVS